jgi:hypothetical protein
MSTAPLTIIKNGMKRIRSAKKNQKVIGGAFHSGGVPSTTRLTRAPPTVMVDNILASLNQCQGRILMEMTKGSNQIDDRIQKEKVKS